MIGVKEVLLRRTEPGGSGNSQEFPRELSHMIISREHPTVTYFYVIFVLSLILSSTSFPLLFERNIFSLISNELLSWEPVLAFVLCYTGIIAVSCSILMLVVFDWLLKI